MLTSLVSNNKLTDDKNFQQSNYTNSNININAFSERKKNLFTKKEIMNKNDNLNKRKYSNKIIFSNRTKNKTISSKIFNSELINKNKNSNVLIRYKLDSNSNNNNNNISMTIYENDSQNIKSIYPRKHKNLSDCFLGVMNSNTNLNNNTNDKVNKKHKNKINLVIKAKNKLNDLFWIKQNLKTTQNRERDKIRNGFTKKRIEMSMSFLNGTQKDSKSLSKRKAFVSSFSINNKNLPPKKIKIIRKEKEKSLYKKIDNNINREKKRKYTPFDFNSIIIIDKKKTCNLNENISMVFNNWDINYTNQKSKYICWKNDIIFEFTIMNKDEKMYYLNIVNKNSDVKAFKNLMNDIINSLSQ